MQQLKDQYDATEPPADEDGGVASEDVPSSSCPSSCSSTSSFASLLDVAGLVIENLAGQLAFNLSARVYHTADVYGKLHGGFV